jgi:hypothetical protein
MRRYLFGSALAGTLAIAATVAAQNPPAQQPPTRTPTTQEPARTVTVEGCLMREADVPGRQPNVAERAGIAEDYILTSTKMVKGTAPAARPTGQTRSGEKPTGTTGMRAAMYEVEGIDDEQLKRLVGQRVQIDGTFENVDQARDRQETQTPADDLVEIRGTTIRQVTGGCSATP